MNYLVTCFGSQLPQGDKDKVLVSVPTLSPKGLGTGEKCVSILPYLVENGLYLCEPLAQRVIGLVELVPNTRHELL